MAPTANSMHDLGRAVGLQEIRPLPRAGFALHWCCRVQLLVPPPPLISMRRPLALAALISLIAAPPVRAQQRGASIDWNKLTTETVNVLAEYIKVNTTNAPGSELQAARFLKRILDKEGIES